MSISSTRRARRTSVAGSTVPGSNASKKLVVDHRVVYEARELIIDGTQLEACSRGRKHVLGHWVPSKDESWSLRKVASRAASAASGQSTRMSPVGIPPRWNVACLHETLPFWRGYGAATLSTDGVHPNSVTEPIQAASTSRSDAANWHLEHVTQFCVARWRIRQ